MDTGSKIGILTPALLPKLPFCHIQPESESSGSCWHSPRESASLGRLRRWRYDPKWTWKASQYLSDRLKQWKFWKNVECTHGLRTYGNVLVLLVWNTAFRKSCWEGSNWHLGSSLYCWPNALFQLRKTDVSRYSLVSSNLELQSPYILEWSLMIIFLGQRDGNSNDWIITPLTEFCFLFKTSVQWLLEIIRIKIKTLKSKFNY